MNQKKIDSSISKIQKSNHFQGDFGLFLAWVILDKKFLVYYNILLGYNFFHEYSSKSFSNDNIIYIVYRYNIHFNSLKDKYGKENIDINMKENLFYSKREYSKYFK